MHHDTPGPYLWLYSLSGDQVGVLDVDIDALELEDRLQSSSELRFTIRGDHHYAGTLSTGGLVRYAEADHADRFYRVAELTQDRIGNAAYLVTVRAEALWYELGDVHKVGVYNLEAETPNAGLYSILANTLWTPAAVQPSDTTPHTIETADETALAILRRWADVTGYELYFDTANREVALVTAVGEDRGAGFLYGRNVTAIKRRVEPPKATRLYAYGANDLTIASANPTGVEYVENYDWFTEQGLSLAEARALHTREQIWVDERFLGAVTLYDRAVERLAELARPTISYEAAVVDITRHGTITEDVAIGDPVRVYDELIGVDLVTRVVRLVHRPLDPRGDDIELAFLRKIASSAGTGATSGRTIDYGRLAVLVDENDDPLELGATLTAWGSIQLSVAGTSTIVTGGTLVATATGAGTLTTELTVDGVPVGDPTLTAFTDSTQLEVSWPSFSADLPEGSHVIQWRSYVSAGTGTLDVAIGAGRAWILTQGAYGVGFGGGASQFVTEVAPPTGPTAYPTATATAEFTVANTAGGDLDELAPAITPTALTAETVIIRYNLIPGATAAATSTPPTVTIT